MPPQSRNLSRDNSRQRRQALQCCNQSSQILSFENRRRSPHLENSRKSSYGCSHQQHQRFSATNNSILGTQALCSSHSIRPPRPIQTGLNRSRSHSRCPACRQDEQQNTSCDHHRVARHHQCDYNPHPATCHATQ